MCVGRLLFIIQSAPLWLRRMITLSSENTKKSVAAEVLIPGNDAVWKSRSATRASLCYLSA